MRYLVAARVRPGQESQLLRAIEEGTLGRGSVAGDEYLANMAQARLCEDGTARWVEVCFCEVPLEEERPYWEEFFELRKVQDAHGRHRCRDLDGSEPWACSTCHCTKELEAKLAAWGEPFLEVLRRAVGRGETPAKVAATAQTAAEPQRKLATAKQRSPAADGDRAA